LICLQSSTNLNLFLFSATVKGLTTFGNTCTSVIHPIQSLKKVSSNTMSFDKGKQSSNQVNRNESPIGRLKRTYDYWQSIKANQTYD
jgi:hypothetical protein